MTYSIGIDIGTSGTKTILIDKCGNLISQCTEEYPLYQPQNGYAEQDPIDWYNAVIKTLNYVVKDSGVDPVNIVGIGLSGQMHGLVMLDSNNQIIRNSIIWCDTRAGKQCDDITALVGKDRLIEITANPAIAGFTAAKILWVKQNEPENYARCHKILLPKDYIRFRLTGEYATEVSDASGMQLLDIKNRCWSDEVLNKLDIDKNLFGAVFESPDITGKTTDGVEQLTGLKVGTIVVGGAGDNAAAAVGTGVVTDNKAFTTIGTSGVMYAHTSTMKVDKDGRVHTFCSAVPNEWHVMGVTQGAGLSIKWFRDNFCYEEIIEAQKQGIDSYILLDRLAEAVRIGADRLVYLPYLMGERTPHLDTNARGVFFGLSASHTKGNLIRAVLEGVSYSLKDCKEILLEMGVPSDDMMLCGGGAKSKLWRSMLADIFGCDISILKSNEGAALGAAILALVGAGEYKTVPAACDSIIKSAYTIQPTDNNTEQYDKFYKIYTSLYPLLRQSYDKLVKL